MCSVAQDDLLCVVSHILVYFQNDSQFCLDRPLCLLHYRPFSFRNWHIVTGPCFSDTVAVPLKLVVLPFVLGLPVILKSLIVCVYNALPSSINIWSVPLRQQKMDLMEQCTSVYLCIFFMDQIRLVLFLSLFVDGMHNDM